jgi:hypothetical protein
LIYLENRVTILVNLLLGMANGDAGDGALARRSFLSR